MAHEGGAAVGQSLQRARGMPKLTKSVQLGQSGANLVSGPFSALPH